MVKRFVDLLIATAVLALLALPMLLIACWIRFDSPGPALYRQVRVGQHGRPFRIHKFRTMHQRAQEDMPLTAEGDSRITRAGRWLRARRLDELPQLLDVLYGHMSLVGPRPEVPRYIDHYPPALRDIVLSVRPGITDPAALSHRHEGQRLAQATDPEQYYLAQILPAKLQMQADYIRQANGWTDLRVLMRTAMVVITR